MGKITDEELIEQYYDVEYSIDDYMNIRNLQENFEDEEYHNEIDRLFARRRELIKELKERKLDCMIANCQADLYF